MLEDGASALYGSDAIAGVVNIITRRNFDGAPGDAQLRPVRRGRRHPDRRRPGLGQQRRALAACSSAPAGPSRTMSVRATASSRASRSRAPAWPSAVAASRRAASSSCDPDTGAPPGRSTPNTGVQQPDATTAASRLRPAADGYHCFATADRFNFAAVQPGADAVRAQGHLRPVPLRPHRQRPACTSRRCATAASRPTRPRPSRSSSARMPAPATARRQHRRFRRNNPFNPFGYRRSMRRRQHRS